MNAVSDPNMNSSFSNIVFLRYIWLDLGKQFLVVFIGMLFVFLRCLVHVSAGTLTILTEEFLHDPSNPHNQMQGTGYLTVFRT
jgi:hypothetical protein